MARHEHRLHDLDQALAALGDQTMMLSQLDGFVAGLLVCPELIPPSEWLPLVWGETDEEDPLFESPAHMGEVVALVMAHYNHVADRLHRDLKHYSVVYDEFEETGETFWEFWIDGFEAAMALRPESWTLLIEAEGEAGAALAMLLTLHEIAHKADDLEQTEDQIKALTEQAPNLIPVCVATLAAERHTGLSSGPAARAKTGRNDPCPCGSGKKFKKCCGAG